MKDTDHPDDTVRMVFLFFICIYEDKNSIHTFDNTAKPIDKIQFLILKIIQ